MKKRKLGARLVILGLICLVGCESKDSTSISSSDTKEIVTDSTAKTVTESEKTDNVAEKNQEKTEFILGSLEKDGNVTRYENSYLGIGLELDNDTWNFSSREELLTQNGYTVDYESDEELNDFLRKQDQFVDYQAKTRDYTTYITCQWFNMDKFTDEMKDEKVIAENYYKSALEQREDVENFESETMEGVTLGGNTSYVLNVSYVSDEKNIYDRFYFFQKDNYMIIFCIQSMEKDMIEQISNKVYEVKN